MKVVFKVGGPKTRPRSSGAEIIGGAHEIPLLQHKELVKGERRQMSAFVGLSMSADDAFEASGRKEEGL